MRRANCEPLRRGLLIVLMQCGGHLLLLHPRTRLHATLFPSTAGRSRPLRPLLLRLTGVPQRFRKTRVSYTMLQAWLCVKASHKGIRMDWCCGNVSLKGSKFPIGGLGEDWIRCCSVGGASPFPLPSFLPPLPCPLSPTPEIDGSLRELVVCAWAFWWLCCVR